MTTDIDAYTPWREPAETLEQRHVARREELDALLGAVRAFLAGRRPLPIYLFGPRGSGKSHLLAMAVNTLRVSSTWRACSSSRFERTSLRSPARETCWTESTRGRSSQRGSSGTARRRARRRAAQPSG